VLGGGFAGSYVARLLGSAGATVVSRENFMLSRRFCPKPRRARSSRAMSSSRCG
jgi:flavin-dependent dehydrogenase